MVTSRTGTSQHKRARARLIRDGLRDGLLVCHWCRIDLDPDAPRHTPRAIELDHLVPVAAGGTDDDDNLALSCWPCNRSKSDRPRPKINRRPKPLPTSRSW